MESLSFRIISLGAAALLLALLAAGCVWYPEPSVYGYDYSYAPPARYYAPTHYAPRYYEPRYYAPYPYVPFSFNLGLNYSYSKWGNHGGYGGRGGHGGRGGGHRGR